MFALVLCHFNLRNDARALHMAGRKPAWTILAYRECISVVGWADCALRLYSAEELWNYVMRMFRGCAWMGGWGGGGVQVYNARCGAGMCVYIFYGPTERPHKNRTIRIWSMWRFWMVSSTRVAWISSRSCGCCGSLGSRWIPLHVSKYIYTYIVAIHTHGRNRVYCSRGTYSGTISFTYAILYLGWLLCFWCCFCCWPKQCFSQKIADRKKIYVRNITRKW